MKAVAIALLTVSAAGTADAEPMPTVQAVLAANRAAVGAIPASGTAELRYSNTSSGMTGPLVVRYDLATGAYAEAQEAQGIRSSDGFDGATPWQQDVSLAYTPQLGGDRPITAASTAYRNAELWWRGDRGGARITSVGREPIDGRMQDHLLVTLKQGHRIDAWFDAKTHLLTRIAEARQFFHTTETYSDYRPENGVMLAHKLVVDPGLGPDGLSTSILQSATFGAARPLNTYAMPRVPLTGAKIVGGATRTTVPFRLLNNHVYVQAKVNGKGPFTFIVDTGGHTLLSHKLVREVGLKVVGAAVTSGAGEGHEKTGFVHFDEIAIGGARLTDQDGFATEIYDPSIEGIPVDGMIGFEIVRRLVTTIDYGAKTLTFTEPSAFRPSPALGTAVPFLFYDHLPNVRGSVLGMPAQFDIDTGSRSEIDFTSPFVNASNLRAKFSRGISAVTGWGVGGSVRGYVVRLPKLSLGGVPVTNIVAGLSESKAGSMSDPAFQGNIGSGLLKRFVVTFDYAHQIMYLKRIAPPPQDIGTFNKSGLWINAKDGGYAITDVAKGSAGADAALSVGDVITAIDGKPVLAERLSDARRLFRTLPAGTKVKLKVRRGVQTRDVTLILKDQI
jgi:predicted aspartyl protease